MHFLEIPKLDWTCYNKAMSPLEQWMLFFKEPDKEHLKELAMNNAEIAKAFESLKVLSHNPTARAEYEARLRALRDINNGMYVNRLEGMAEGKMEEKLEMARKMKVKGVPLEMIMELTALTQQQINTL